MRVHPIFKKSHYFISSSDKVKKICMMYCHGDFGEVMEELCCNKYNVRTKLNEGELYVCVLLSEIKRR